MKVLPPFGRKMPPTTRQDRSERMGDLLALWREAPPHVRRDGAFHSGGSQQHTDIDLSAWHAVLDAVTPFPPVTHLPGLRRLLSLDPDAPSLDELVETGTIKIEGARVGIANYPSEALRAIPLRESWMLFAAGLQEPEIGVVESRFRDTYPIADGVVLMDPVWDLLRADAIHLGYRALAAANDKEIDELWWKAVALNAEEQFLDILPGQLRVDLAERLLRELKAAGDTLCTRVDLDLAVLGTGQSFHLRPETLPSCRLSAILHAQRQFSQWGHHQDTGYPATSLRALVSCGNHHQIMMAFSTIPPGRTLLQGLDFLRRRRPALLAHLLWHVQGNAEGWLGVDGLPPQRRLGPARHIEHDLKHEWAELQHLARWQFLLPERPEAQDPLNPISMALHDEERHLMALMSEHRRLEPHVDPESYAELWKMRLATRKQSKQLVSRLVKHLGSPGQRTDAELALSLRLAGLLEDTDRALSVEVLRAFVEAYAAGLSLDEDKHSIPHGLLLLDLLPVLGRCLPVDAPDLWRRWLKPFDAQILLKAAADDRSHRDTIHSGRVYPSFEVPDLFVFHVEALLQSAEGVGEAASAVLETVTEMYQISRREQLWLAPFEWNRIGQVSTLRPRREPVFLPFGRLAQSVVSNGGDRIVRGLLRTGPDMLVLAQIAAGLCRGSRLHEEIGAHLADLSAEASLERMALGESLELASTLGRCGLYPAAERFAKYARGVADENRQANSYLAHAVALQAECMVAQGKWDAVLGLPDVSGSRGAARHVNTMKALAQLERGRPKRAEKVLRRVLKEQPDHGLALVNLPIVLIRQEKWEDALVAINEARERLGAEVPASLQANEHAVRSVLAGGEVPKELPNTIISDHAPVGGVLPEATHASTEGDGEAADVASIEHLIRRHKLALEVMVPDNVDEVSSKPEVLLQRELCRFLIEHGVVASGTKFGRSETDLVGAEDAATVVVETKKVTTSPTKAEIKKWLVQLQSYMDQELEPPVGVLLIYNLSETLVVAPRNRIRDSYCIVAVNLLKEAPSKRKRSVQIVESKGDNLIDVLVVDAATRATKKKAGKRRRKPTKGK